MKKLILVLVILFIPLPSPAKGVDREHIEQELYWLALNVYHEARNQRKIKDRLVVAYVVLNRVYSDQYPNTIRGVITQPSQFAWYWDTNPDKPNEFDAWKDAYDVAVLALNTFLPDKHVDGGMWYHAKSINPHWADGLTLVAEYGEHKVYK